MNKKWLFLGFGISLFALAGCGQLNKLDPNPGDTDLSPLNSAKHVNIIATSKIKITLGDKKSGVSAQSIETSLIASQSVEIEADVPSFMTFQANSSIFFNVTQLGLINADGTITLNVVYNDLISQDLQGVRVRAYMVEANGLHGQQVSGNIIPLDIQVVNGIPYQPLTTSSANMKVWNAPFMQAINEQVVLKLRGNFTYALKQQYKGTIMLEFVRDKNIDSLPPGMPTNFTASAGDQRVTLNWTNPADNDLKEVEVRVATNSYPVLVTDGTLVYKGLNQSYCHTGLTNGTTYYYSIFARDNAGNISSANRSSAMPRESIDQYVKLLLHLNNDWTDSSNYPHTIYQSDSLSFSSTTKQFGSHSIYKPSGKVFYLPTSNDWNFPAGTDFTIEFWYYPTLRSNDGFLFAIGNPTGWFTVYEHERILHLRQFNVFDYTAGSLKDTWQHIVVERYNNTLRLYQDGIALITQPCADDVGYPGNPLIFGGESTSDTERMAPAGYFDEIRITKGTAVYRGEFTSPTHEF